MQNHIPPPQTYPIIYNSQAPNHYNPPRSCLEMGFKNYALTFFMMINNQEVIIKIQNPLDKEQIVTEGMKLAMETYSQYQWAMP